MNPAVFRFLSPWALWLLLLLPLYLYWAHFSRSPLERRRLALVTLLRTLLLLLVCLALARPVLFRRSPGRVVVVVEDDSASAAGAAEVAARRIIEGLEEIRRPGDRILRVRFGARASAGEEGDVDPSGSDLEGALRLAGALVPRGAPGAVVAVTDGGADRGRPGREAWRLALRGIPVHVAALSREPGADAWPARAVLPDPWYPGETRQVRVLLEAARDGRGEVRLFLDGKPGPFRQVEVRRSAPLLVTLPLKAGRPGAHLLEVRWRASWDREGSNDILRIPLAVQDPPLVLWCRSGPGDPAALLEGEGFSVRRISPAALAGALEAARVPDLVVLDDVPARALGRRTMEDLARLVSFNGTGLLLAGATSSFGPGGYAGTPLEPLLPLSLEQREERRDPSVALVLIIDTSGSMGNRVDLAKEVARLAIRRLKPHDKVGIVEFYGHKRWAAPLQPASNQIEILRALNRLQAGGGTVLLPAIEEAYYGLLNVTTRFKHVLILTDGGVERGAFEPLVRRMAEAGITVSTVLVGPGRDSDFLLDLAQWGRGRYYQAPGRFDLPEIILKQPTSSLLPPFLSFPLAVRKGVDAPELRGFDLSQAPPLGGAVETRPRPGAQVLLVAGGGSPLYARWRWGLGAAACWTTQTQGPLLGDWAGWKDYGPLMRSLLRALVRRGGRPRLQVRAEREGRTVLLTAKGVDRRGLPFHPARLEVYVGGKAAARAAPFAPGRFRVRLPAGKGGEAWTVRVSGEKDVLSRRVAVPFLRSRAEKALGERDRAVLSSLLASPRARMDPAPASLLPPAGGAGRILPRLLSPWLLLAALLLYLLEILLRRLPSPRPGKAPREVTP